MGSPSLRTGPCLLLALLLCTCAPAPEARFAERADTGVNSTNRLHPTEAFNIVAYLYYFNGGGVAATDISGDGLADLYFTNNQGANKYYVNEGNWRFRDATAEGGVAGAGQWTTGVSVTDINGDGLPDIYVCNVSGYAGLTGRNELFVQAPNGTFTNRAADYGLDLAGFSTQAYWFDYDRDGDEDLYLLRHSVHNDATYGRAQSRGVPDSLAGDLLLRRDGPTTFTDVTGQAGIYSSKIGYGLSAAIADFDGNGYPDIYVCNDFSENDYLYLNRNGERFEERVRGSFGHTSNFSMGSDVGDLDADGRPDLITLDMRPGEEAVLKSTASADPYNVYRVKRRSGYYDQSPRNNVQWNRGGGRFSEIGELTGLAATDWSWSVLIDDLSLDGWPEVFVANGIERRPNDLDYLKFVSSSLAREASNLAVVEQMPSGHVSNQLFARHGPLRYGEVDWGLGFAGSSTGAATADLDGDGDLDLVVNNVNAPAKVYENRTLTGAVTVTRIPAKTGWPEMIISSGGGVSGTLIHALTLHLPPGTGTGYQIELADGRRFSAERQAQRGFQSQSENVFTIGLGAGGEPFRLRRTPGGGAQSETMVVDPATGTVVPGGSAPERSASPFTVVPAGVGHRSDPVTVSPFDREPLRPYATAGRELIEPLGSGNFRLSTGRDATTGTYTWDGTALRMEAPAPAARERFVAGDFDGDGITDRLLIGRPIPDGYGRYETTRWLRGGGGGTFTAADFPLQGISCAAYLPGAGLLFVGGEWQPIRYGRPVDGRWQFEEIPGTEGWWQSLSVVPGADGPAVIAGNWGLNSALGRPTEADPLRLYRLDIDGNGRVDPLITYVREGREYTLADKDELSAQFPAWRKNNLSYTDFSRRSFQENFPELDRPTARATTLAHLRISAKPGGGYRAVSLPAAAQVTTLNAAVATPVGVLLGGNTLDVLPRVGRQDAAALQLLRPNGHVQLIDLGGAANRAEVAAIAALDGGHWLIALRDGDWRILALK